MTVLPDDFTKELWAKCGDCGHLWCIAKYPAPMHVVAAQIGKKPTCPNCGSKKVLIAKQNNGELNEEPSS